MKRLFYIFLPLVALLGACSSETGTTTSSDATVSSFSLRNDSFPGLKATTFVIEHLADTGRIYPKDSILFGSRLDSVIPSITFSASPSAAYLIMRDTTILLSGADTLDFNKQPIYLKVVASDAVTVKWYKIEAYVHQIDPYLFNWECLTPAFCTAEPGTQQALLVHNRLYWFNNNGFATQAYSSLDGYDWTDLQVSGLPEHCDARHIVYSEQENRFLYAQDSTLYSSTDGATWIEEQPLDPGYRFVCLLYELNHLTWAILERANSTQWILAYRDAMHQWNYPQGMFSGDTLPGNFPLSDFATVTYTNDDGQQHALLMGGYDRKGQMSNGAWNIECVKRYNDDESVYYYRVADYGASDPNRDKLSGIALVWYDHKLYRFGGLNATGAISDTIRWSNDEGYTFYKADTTKNFLPLPYTPRQLSSVVTDGEYLYLIGGRDFSTHYADVYRARLNSIDW